VVNVTTILGTNLALPDGLARVALTAHHMRARNRETARADAWRELTRSTRERRREKPLKAGQPYLK
jgi:hypothetical protein